MTKKEMIRSLVELKSFLLYVAKNSRELEKIKILDNVIEELDKKALCDKEKIIKNTQIKEESFSLKKDRIIMTFSLTTTMFCEAYQDALEYCTKIMHEELIQWFEE